MGHFFGPSSTDLFVGGSEDAIRITRGIGFDGAIVTHPTAIDPRTIAAADLDGDGLTDLVAAGPVCRPDEVRVLIRCPEVKRSR